ncbi:MAG: alpha/beta fold hydrolase [Bacteroidota bacterium]
MNSVRIKFPNEQGLLLSARLELPVSGRPKAYAVFAHCFTCSKNLNAVGHISSALTAKGIAVLRFDFTGLGQSEGEFADSNFSSQISDLIAAYQYLEENHVAPQIFIGHSLGGAAVLHAAGLLPSLKAVVTIGAPADPPHVKHLFTSNLEEIVENGEATVNIGGRPFKIKKQFIDDLEQADATERIKDLNKALLILHSPQDTTVGIENAAQIYTAARHPKSFISLDGADHLMTREVDSLYVGEVISSWVVRYIALPSDDPLETDDQVVVKTHESGYTTDMLVGGHAMIADEPTDVGGSNLGPSPYGYLAAALGSCTSMTLRMYADHKKWDLKEVTVHLSHNKKHSVDCDNCEQKGAKIDHFERVIELEGNLDDSQRQRLLEIADKCPVHRTLHSDVKVITRLQD